MLAIVVGMFAFCFALVPMYTAFCKVTGLNGKTAGQTTFAGGEIDYSREVTVELLATLHETIPYQFEAKQKKYTLHPGEYITTSYRVKNLMPKEVVVQAIPSVTPGLAARHIRKIECFCFQRQPLMATEDKEMSLVFTVDPELPQDIRTITLAYTLFDVTKNEGGKA